MYLSLLTHLKRYTWSVSPTCSIYYTFDTLLQPWGEEECEGCRKLRKENKTYSDKLIVAEEQVSECYTRQSVVSCSMFQTRKIEFSCSGVDAVILGSVPYLTAIFEIIGCFCSRVAHHLSQRQMVVCLWDIQLTHKHVDVIVWIVNVTVTSGI
mgnify:CR=1 FL=1